ncbi:MAG: hypothetical protein AAB728_05785 [Patescibacteria group bacterium]
MADIIERPDGTFLYPLPGATNTHLNHYHVASDGTILSIVESGQHQYERRELREKINAVTGMKFPPLYTVKE